MLFFQFLNIYHVRLDKLFLKIQGEKMKYLTLAVIIVMGVFLSGCASKYYEEARTKDTVFAYNQFLKEYGDSEYANKVRYTRNALIAFNKAKKKNTIDGYDSFLTEYESSRYSYSAKSKKDLLLQKSDYDEAIQNEEEDFNYYTTLENNSKSKSPNRSVLGFFSAFISEVVKRMTYDEYLIKWEYKGNFQ